MTIQGARLGDDHVQLRIADDGCGIPEEELALISLPTGHSTTRDEDHARSLLSSYLQHYRRARPHQGLEQRTPEQARDGVPVEPVRPRDGERRRFAVETEVRPVLNGLIHEFWVRAA